ncbi:MAG: hypothetical protein IJS08_12780 [Victivallales bacterium]|nr:hypothetical protein [Victivallales bacterium]
MKKLITILYLALAATVILPISSVQGNPMTMEALLAKLNSEPELTAAIEVLPNTNPKFVLNGRKVDALLYNAPYPWKYDEKNTQEKIANFHQGGIDLLSLGIGLNECWRADGSIDKQYIASTLYRALALNPDAYLNLSITTNDVGWWIKAYPGELTDYANGGVDPKARDAILNVRAASFASRKWRKDVTGALRSVVAFVESIPAGKRVFSYRVDFGIYREWHYFGMREGMPGCCPAMCAAFREYLAKKYHTDEALQVAWNDPNVTLKNADIPSAKARLDSIAGGMTLRDPVKNCPVVDFLHTMQYEMRDLVLACNQAVKEASHFRKLCGNYHGYLFGMEFPVEAWHLENEMVLASRFVDWQASPNLYSNREIDDAEFGRSPVESYTLRGKIAIQEHDSRTHLSVEDPYYTHVTTPAQSVTTLARDFTQSLCRNAGCWYMDFARDWYNDPQILALFRKLAPIRAMATHNAPVSQVAVVADLESIYYHKISTRRLDLVFDCNVQELTHAATPFDVLLLSDLENPAVRDYQVYIFPNLFYLTPQKAAIIQRLRSKGKNLVWLYAPGYLNEKGHDAANIQALTGFKVRENSAPYDGTAFLHGTQPMKPISNVTFAPSFDIVEESVQPWGTRTAHGKELTFAMRLNGTGKEFYSTTGFLSRNAWKELFAACGVHCYEESGTTVVWVSSAFISINGKPGKYTLKLPIPRRVTELLPEKGNTSEPITTIDLKLTNECGLKLYHLK